MVRHYTLRFKCSDVIFRRYKFSRYTFSIYTFRRYTLCDYMFSRWIISLFKILQYHSTVHLVELSGAVSGTEWRCQQDWLARSVMSATDMLGQLGCMWLVCCTPSSGQWTNVRTMKLKDTVIFSVAASYHGAVWELPNEAVRPYSTVILTS
jgi:hypothetical protein